MKRPGRCLHPVKALCAAVLALLAPRLASCHGMPPTTRRLEIMVNEDDFAEAILTADVPLAFGLGLHNHEGILSTLEMTKGMVDLAKVLIRDDRTIREGRDLIERANAMFSGVKDSIKQQFQNHKETQTQAQDDERDLLRQKYSDHDMKKAQEEEKRALDTSRRIYEMMVTFPDCVEKIFEECLAIINGDLVALGLSTIEVVVREKRNISQEGYNKVVIITNELADRVKGRAGDGIINYPFLWQDASLGQRVLGVDGKWNCHDLTPDSCCDIIKQSVPNADSQGNFIECHIFVPFGGVGNPRRNDRVFINLSPDGRVHEPPIIQ